MAIISALFATLGGLQGNQCLATCIFHCLAQTPDMSPFLLFEQHLYVRNRSGRDLCIMVLSHTGADWAAVTSLYLMQQTSWLTKNVSQGSTALPTLCPHPRPLCCLNSHHGHTEQGSESTRATVNTQTPPSYYSNHKDTPGPRNSQVP